MIRKQVLNDLCEVIASKEKTLEVLKMAAIWAPHLLITDLPSWWYACWTTDNVQQDKIKTIKIFCKLTDAYLRDGKKIIEAAKAANWNFADFRHLLTSNGNYSELERYLEGK